MLEIFVVVIIILILVGLLLPSVQSLRENARRTSCKNNLMQIGLAVHLYHETFDQFPVHLNGTDGSSLQGGDNNRRLSILVALLPFIDQGAVHNWIRSGQPNQSVMAPLDPNTGLPVVAPVGVDDEEVYDGMMAEDLGAQLTPITTKIRFTPPGGPPVTDSSFAAWVIEIPTYRCPSDPGYGNPAMGRTNYAASLGDGVLTINSGPFKEVMGKLQFDEELQRQCDASMRGVFIPRTVTRRSDVTDGASNTLLLGEICTGLGDRDRRTDALVSDDPEVLIDQPDSYKSWLDNERSHFWLSGAVCLTSSNAGWGRGFRWHDGMPNFTSFQTILPPNAAVVAREKSDASDGIFCASSRHTEGINVCFVDGAVRFVNNKIDCGEDRLPTVYPKSQTPPGSESPYGVWGALGTRGSSEMHLE